MRSFRTLDRRAGYSLSAFGLLLAMLAPGLVPAFASADALTSRSIQLSSSSKSATDVTYDVKFTAAQDAGAYVIDFCKNSSVVGAACTAPTGFSTTAVDTDTAGATASKVTISAVDRAVKVVQTIDVSADATIEVVLTGINNPSVANDSSNGLYARILTYADSTAADGYTSGTVVGSPLDTGSVALSINDTIGVSAAVMETMTFCVASQTISDNCGDAAAHLPNVVLGDATTGLDSGVLSTANLYAQISTNAVHGAVVNLKSSAVGCGGLLRAGDLAACDIGPATQSDASHTLSTFGKALFGLKTGSATGDGGTFQGVGNYASDYYIQYASDNTSGVTSPYGSTVLDTDGGVTDSMTMPLTFGASISNTTPSGSYSADLSMIATGTY